MEPCRPRRILESVPDPAPGSFPPLSEPDRSFLLRLARNTIRNATGAGPFPHVDASSLPPALLVRRGCFVTLFHRGKLRGCIGHIFPQEPLFRTVIEAAHGAALRDPRFPAVLASEMDELTIEISVLTEPVLLAAPVPAARISCLVPKRHGVVLRVGGRSWTFLPQVWEHFPEAAEFLGRLCLKAGIERNAWQDEQVELLRYEVESFEEGMSAADPVSMV